MPSGHLRNKNKKTGHIRKKPGSLLGSQRGSLGSQQHPTSSFNGQNYSGGGGFLSVCCHHL